MKLSRGLPISCGFLIGSISEQLQEIKARVYYISK